MRVTDWFFEILFPFGVQNASGPLTRRWGWKSLGAKLCGYYSLEKSSTSITLINNNGTLKTGAQLEEVCRIILQTQFEKLKLLQAMDAHIMDIYWYRCDRSTFLNWILIKKMYLSRKSANLPTNFFEYEWCDLVTPPSPPASSLLIDWRLHFYLVNYNTI